jgi:DNA-binding response OmpR family regulator
MCSISVPTHFVGKRLLGGGGELSLSALAFHLLKVFVRHPHAVLTREQLLTAVWPPGFAGIDHAVDQAIYALRRVVEPDPSHPRYLCTRRGLGYVYCPPGPEERT